MWIRARAIALATFPASFASGALCGSVHRDYLSNIMRLAHRREPTGFRTNLRSLGLLGLVIVGGNGNVGLSLRRYVGLLPWLLLVLVCSCGGGGGSTGGGSSGSTPAGTYAVTVTAKLNGVNESIPLTLKVQ
ncbi:MAG TPA: hypothetical protein VEI99_06840 [Terriglobales bacterium]|nr:hypothetical protein [Terriglobales bacterium]